MTGGGGGGHLEESWVAWREINEPVMHIRVHNYIGVFSVYGVIYNNIHAIFMDTINFILMTTPFLQLII